MFTAGGLLEGVMLADRFYGDLIWPRPDDYDVATWLSLAMIDTLDVLGSKNDLCEGEEGLLISSVLFQERVY